MRRLAPWTAAWVAALALAWGVLAPATDGAPETLERAGSAAPGPAPEGPDRTDPDDRGGRSEAVRIRIGLASDLTRFELPCCAGRVTLTIGGESTELEGPLSIEPAAGTVDAPEHRLQVAALKDRRQAEALARDLAQRTGWPADARFDASTGLYRVRAGRFDRREEAEAGRDRLAALGLGSAWVTQEGGAMSEPALRVRWHDRSFRVLGRWVAIEPEGDAAAGSGGGDRADGPLEPLEIRAAALDPVQPAAAGRYRGRLLLYLNDRGALNLINELPVEQYLRGVVPRELGPALYPRLEALKAQTVAARTYALHHLGEFDAEGFDLCAGVRCQVYGGVGAEHPLSDRAVAETTGQVLLYDGKLIEALYSATCGGHTEDAELVFPWMDAPYLRGVPCPEAGTARLGGDLAAGTPFPAGLTRRLVPPPGGSPRRALEERLRTVARAAGLPLPGDRLASLDRREVRRFVRSLFDLVLDPRLLADPAAATPEAITRLGSVLPAALRPAEPLEDLHRGGTLHADEAEWLVLSLSQVVGLLDEEELRFRELGPAPDGGGSVLRATRIEDDGEEAVERTLPDGVMTFRRRDGKAVATALDLAAGDRLTLYRWQGVPRALVQTVRSPRPGAADPANAPARQARLRTWRRFRSDARLAELVAQRYPGLGFRGFEVVSRGISGRVGAIRLLGDGDRSVRVEGLAVRWTLDLPDTRFEARRVTGAGGEPGWMFTGGGWGHGVGMCQIGAYTMAGRGLDYQEILRYYYTGARLGRVVVRSAGLGRTEEEHG